MTYGELIKMTHDIAVQEREQATERQAKLAVDRDCGCSGTEGCGSRYCPRPSP